MTRLEEINLRFTKVDWTNLDSIITTFPTYKQELIALKKDSKKMSNRTNIEMFNLWTPYKDKQLLKSTELIIEPKRRYALFGENGCGKTTLFRALADGSLYDKGMPKHISTLHMEEIETSPDNGTIMETVLNSHELLYCLRKCKTELKKLILVEKKEEYITNLEFINEELRILKSDTAEERISKMLKPLGFNEKAQQKNVNTLSGGLRMRVALVCAFFQKPDLLLLDDPTNHLDFPSVLWLENRLRTYHGSFILVTHDRNLLENVCNNVIIFSEKDLVYYNMDFPRFEKKKALDDAKMFKERELFINRNRNPDPSTPLGARVAKYREWIKKYIRKQFEKNNMFTFPESKKLTHVDSSVAQEDIPLIEMKDVTFKYPGTDVFIFKNKTNCTITASTRMGIMGPNGVGKSTFLKLLTRRLTPTTGTINTNKDFKLAYFGQHSAQELDLSMTPFEWMCKMYSNVPEKEQGKLKHHLNKAGIHGEMTETAMKGFSGGQKALVIFAKLTFSAPHLLIMDEPTNFLDLETVDALIKACNKYKGAMLLVTHSRHMLHSCGNIYLSITPGNFKFFGDIKSCERSTYKFINELEDGGKVKVTSVQGGSGEHEEEEFSQEAIMRRRKKMIELENIKKQQKLEKKKKEEKVVINIMKSDWKVGDECMAFWGYDRKFYKAKIHQILKKRNKYCVIFDGWNNYATVHPSQLALVDSKISKEYLISAYLLYVKDIKMKAEKDKLKRQKRYSSR